MNKQLEFRFMEDLLTPTERILRIMGEESSIEFDRLFLEKIKKLYNI
jgi:hypothetical protein